MTPDELKENIGWHRKTIGPRNVDKLQHDVDSLVRCSENRALREAADSLEDYAIQDVPHMIRVLRKRADAIEQNIDDDWTRGVDGRTNTSPMYFKLTQAVTALLAGTIGGIASDAWLESTAGLIVAQLAHKHGLRPTERP